ncbi:DUF397 domain-containing protein [Yinghuangia aomiensis]|uniref:DUF397 domain-containing protein n=1 Tax=Yinghuangia aomiensis TaxID=676205 RepID=UPI0031E614F1
MDEGVNVADFATSAQTWRRSSHSAGGTNCLEVRRDDGILVRDSQGLEKGVLAFPATAWQGLLLGV